MIARTILLLVLGLVLGFELWVRLAPVDVERWHVPPDKAKWPREGGYRLDIEAAVSPEKALSAWDDIVMKSPRTRRLAGSPSERMITYETRPRVWGFPDYTTVAAEAAGNGARLAILGRLRFGRGDFGVNRARIKRWVGQLREVLQ